MATKNKFNNLNLLIFLELPWNNHGVARVFFNKLMLKKIIKIIKKNRKKTKSKIVILISEFLNFSDDFLKIQLLEASRKLPKNLLNDLSFLLIENYKNLSIFLKNKEKDIMIVTLIKNATTISESDWIVEETKQAILTKKLSQEYNLNVIAFHEPEKEKYISEKPLKTLGNIKVFLQTSLLKEWTTSNDLEIIFSNLKNEKIFTTFSFSVSSSLSQISNNILFNMAQLIFQQLTLISQTLIKFPNGLILHFTFDENEKLQFLNIIAW